MKQNYDIETLENCMESYLRSKGINPRRNFACPVCGGGQKTPCATYYDDSPHIHCFTCGWTGNVIDLIGHEYGISDPGEKIRKAAQVLGFAKEETPSKSPSKPRYPAEKAERTESFQPLTEAAQAYLISRDLLWDAAKFQSTADGKSIVIPYPESDYYVTRSIEGKVYRYPKNKPREVFALPVLYRDDPRPVFVVEGQMDALSIFRLGYHAVALGGCGSSVLLDALQKQPTKRMLILAPDNDDPGRKGFADLQSALDERGIPAVTCHLWETCKDANELLCADADRFAENLADASENAAAILERQELEIDAEYRKNSVQGQMAEFCAAIRGNHDHPPISTGFPKLDAALGGGLYPGLYILGAVSSLGKTTFFLQIAEFIAACNRDVMIFSLEMSRMELIAKGLSRETYDIAEEYQCAKGDALTAREILQYDLCTENRKKLFQAALPRFESRSRHLFICEAEGCFSVEDLKDALHLHRRKTGRYPVVVLDYLQILTPKDANASDKQNTDRAVTELKQLSRSLDIPVLAISSINRAGYHNVMMLNAFKESGSIEYGADVLMGLEFQGVGEKDFDLEAAKAEKPRKINLRILKNRSGESGALIPLEYYAMFNFFRAG